MILSSKWMVFRVRNTAQCMLSQTLILMAQRFLFDRQAFQSDGELIIIVKSHGESKIASSCLALSAIVWVVFKSMVCGRGIITARISLIRNETHRIHTTTGLRLLLLLTRKSIWVRHKINLLLHHHYCRKRRNQNGSVSLSRQIRKEISCLDMERFVGWCDGIRRSTSHLIPIYCV